MIVLRLSAEPVHSYWKAPFWGALHKLAVAFLTNETPSVRREGCQTVLIRASSVKRPPGSIELAR